VHTKGFVPVQTPPWHVSVCVHAFPSVQALPFGFVGFEQSPVAESHVPATWHWSCAVHVTGVPAHVPPEQTSPFVHGLPSSHDAVFATCVHAPAPLQTSFVHGFPSLAHALPLASKWHVDEQQSPSTVLPSSQSSPGSRMPFPHGMLPGQNPPG
jgi:hypothetical protein